MSDELRFPIGMQSFEELRKNGYAYVDKTQYFRDLFKNKYYFLSRPRRFGKSLLLSTLEAYFKGKKELFVGLEIEKWETDWIEYPIVHIDFNNINGSNTDSLIRHLADKLFEIADDYGVGELKTKYPIVSTDDIGPLFSYLLKQLYAKCGRQSVILIDEYDKGILDVLHDEQLLEKATVALRPFFNVLKSCDSYIKFAMVTGVSRFRNTTLFSGANNLRDISLDPLYSSILGISQNELIQYFEQSIHTFANANEWTYESTLEELKNKYDGYRFTRAKELVYNPFSILSALNSKYISNFWIKTGSTISLERHLKDSHFDLNELTVRWVSEEDLERTYSPGDPLSLFFQTGYLTIKDFDGVDYKLGIPNQEVQSSLVKMVIPEFVEGLKRIEIDSIIRKIRLSLNTGAVDSMMETIKSLLARIPYHEIDTNAQEKHLHLCFYVIFLMMGADAKCEVASSGGRVDMVVETPWRIYVFEFKIDKSPVEAMKQIEEKGYAIPWEARGRQVIKIAVEFSSSLRTISRWITKA